MDVEKSQKRGGKKARPEDRSWTAKRCFLAIHSNCYAHSNSKLCWSAHDCKMIGSFSILPWIGEEPTRPLSSQGSVGSLLGSKGTIAEQCVLLWSKCEQWTKKSLYLVCILGSFCSISLVSTVIDSFSWESFCWPVDWQIHLDWLLGEVSLFLFKQKASS